MRRVLRVAFFIAILGRSVEAATLTVSGVVLLPDGSRAGGIDVGLYSALKKGKPLAQDRTPVTGVYILTATNIIGPVGDLFVRYEGDKFLARPVRAHLKGTEGRMWQARPDDLRLMPNEPAAQEVGDHIAAFADSAQVDFLVGLIDQETANQKVGREIARVTKNSSEPPLALYNEVQKKTEFADHLAVLQPDEFFQAVAHKSVQIVATPSHAYDWVWKELGAALLALGAIVSGVGLYLRHRRRLRRASLLRITNVQVLELDQKWRLRFSFKDLELPAGERLFIQAAANPLFQEPLISEELVEDESLGRGFIDVPLDGEPSLWLRLFVRNRESRMLYAGVAQRFDIVAREDEAT
jgi:hypothetical protein